jgi:hypothetical protein
VREHYGVVIAGSLNPASTTMAGAILVGENLLSRTP